MAQGLARQWPPALAFAQMVFIRSAEKSPSSLVGSRRRCRPAHPHHVAFHGEQGVPGAAIARLAGFLHRAGNFARILDHVVQRTELLIPFRRGLGPYPFDAGTLSTACPERE